MNVGEADYRAPMAKKVRALIEAHLRTAVLWEMAESDLLRRIHEAKVAVREADTTGQFKTVQRAVDDYALAMMSCASVSNEMIKAMYKLRVLQTEYALCFSQRNLHATHVKVLRDLSNAVRLSRTLDDVASAMRIIHGQLVENVKKAVVNGATNVSDFAQVRRAFVSTSAAFLSKPNFESGSSADGAFDPNGDPEEVCTPRALRDMTDDAYVLFIGSHMMRLSMTSMPMSGRLAKEIKALMDEVESEMRVAAVKRMMTKMSLMGATTGGGA